MIRRSLLAFDLHPSRAKQTVRTLTLPEPAKLDRLGVDEYDALRVLRIHLKAILPSGATILVVSRHTRFLTEGLFPQGTILWLRTTYRRAFARRRRQAAIWLEVMVPRPDPMTCGFPLSSLTEGSCGLPYGHKGICLPKRATPEQCRHAIDHALAALAAKSSTGAEAP